MEALVFLLAVLFLGVLHMCLRGVDGVDASAPDSRIPDTGVDLDAWARWNLPFGGDHTHPALTHEALVRVYEEWMDVGFEAHGYEEEDRQDTQARASAMCRALEDMARRAGLLCGACESLWCPGCGERGALVQAWWRLGNEHDLTGDADVRARMDALIADGVARGLVCGECRQPLCEGCPTPACV